MRFTVVLAIVFRILGWHQACRRVLSKRIVEAQVIKGDVLLLDAEPMRELDGLTIVRENQIPPLPVRRDEGFQSWIVPVGITVAVADFQRPHGGRYVMPANRIFRRVRARRTVLAQPIRSRRWPGVLDLCSESTALLIGMPSTSLFWQGKASHHGSVLTNSHSGKIPVFMASQKEGGTS
jgi:hypothetical protein